MPTTRIDADFVEWSDFDAVAARADSLIGSANRFRMVITAPPGGQAPLNKNDLLFVKRIRNAVAHKSDYAWASSVRSRLPLRLD